MRLTAGTACYRREAGSAGRDTRGLLRVHEFDKVELFAYATEEQSAAEHAGMVGRAESLLRELDLEYRVLDLCTGDLGNAVGAHLRHRGVRAGVRHVARGVLGELVHRLPGPAGQHPLPQPAVGGQPVFVHTLNGSAIAWARVWAALVETGRQADGSVVLPAVLAPYLGGHVRHRGTRRLLTGTGAGRHRGAGDTNTQRVPL